MLIESTINEGVPGVWFWMYRWLFRAGAMGSVWAATERLTLCFMLAAVVSDSFRICLFDVAERYLWGMRDVARRAFADWRSRTRRGISDEIKVFVSVDPWARAREGAV
jgi:hypothetical protein